MKALLQQPETGLYFKGLGQWTPDPDEAHDFKSSVTARSYCQNQGILNAQIVLKFSLDKYDIVMPAQYPVVRSDSSGPALGL